MVGYIGVQSLDDASIRIGILGVDPDFQNQKIGTKIISAIKEIFKSVSKIELDTIQEETSLVNFYLHNGFQLTDQTEEIKDGMHLVRMEYKKAVA
jgi:GNAT superfamily N-acetyltransferase